MPTDFTSGLTIAKSFNAAERAVWERTVAAAGSNLKPPRLLVVLAHPDDQVLVLGGRLERLSRARLATVTDGAPKDGADALHLGFPSLAAYRDARRVELAMALAHAGLPSRVTEPFSALPPVADQEASLHLGELTRGLVSVLDTFAPEAVLTHPYEGGHPDHDACAFAVHTALRLRRHRLAKTKTIGATSADAQPLLIEAPFYYNNGSGGLQTGSFLHADRFPSLTLRLSPQEQANKQARLAFFASQTATLQQFRTESEFFRPAPDYNFHEPPHAGRLLYECFPWGMTGARFRALADEAERRLFDGTSDPLPSLPARQAIA